ncbi:DPEP2 neighbor protein-like isoform X2 [Fukomys damarensis]|uniref:DPEP2 neighbor protein-like isoform X2 n=1 Tax=Fukomys damarensis TaxID=885580 RepID=UPI0014551692|nr:DPEP2 neighbor protein-like isoform X2 [Fukomys damarensis]
MELLHSGAQQPMAPPTPVYYHVLYRRRGETQVSWHGETYCLVGGYRSYGDAAIATPVKVKEEKPESRWPDGDASTVTPIKAKAEKPVSIQVLKRPRFMEEYNQQLGGPSPKIRQLNNGDKTEEWLSDSFEKMDIGGES